MPDTNPAPSDVQALTPEQLRWRCDPALFSFGTTAEVDPLDGVVGQDDALEALRFGLEIHAPGQNVFVRGLTGTGRSTLLRKILEQIDPPRPEAPDICYTHNFDDPGRPALIALPRGDGRAFQDRMDELAVFLGNQLAPALASDALHRRKEALDHKLQEQLKEASAPFEADLAAAGLTMVTLKLGGGMQPAVFPMVGGEAVPPDKLGSLVQNGKISQAEADALVERIPEFGKRFQQLSRELAQLREGHRLAVRGLYEQEARRILQGQVADIVERFPQPAVATFLTAVVEDVVRTGLRAADEALETRRYRVNAVLCQKPGRKPPVVVETTPTLRNLLGVIDREVSPQGATRSDHLMIQTGSLLRANGGYLILEASDVLQEPGAWKVLIRALRTGCTQVVPDEAGWFGAAMLQPEPIPIDVKVVLLGDPGLHMRLDALDPDFPHLFKVLADFETSIPVSDAAVRSYAGVLARLRRDEQLAPFTREGAAALVEHAARIAGRRDRLTTRFGRLADLAREASFLAAGRGADAATDSDVYSAIQRTRQRAGMPSRQFRERIGEGTIRIQCSGEEVGQINGLAVTRSGQLSYGFPARITATIGPGTSGAINIEREAMLSGAIHTKGFYILGGLLRHLLRTPHPLAFSASIAFEQSYGGIDGDSASGAEICCLLSALTGVPLRQDLSMTGAIDQFGNVQAIGAASEKIEGFFDVCADVGLSGTQGVLIPSGNVRDLMLRRDIVDACREGRFRVYPVANIQQALGLLTGWEVGVADEAGTYPEGTLLRRAVDEATAYWRLAAANPSEVRLVDGEDAEDASADDSAPTG